MSEPDPEVAPAGIAVIGMSGRFPGAASVAELWRMLRAGRSGISRLSDEELAAAGVSAAERRDPRYVRAAGVLGGAEMFDAGLFGLTPREAEVMDPQLRVFLECAWEALEDAGHDPERFGGWIGVYAGAAIGRYLWMNVARHPEALAAVGTFQAMISNDKDYLATQVSYRLNLRGPGIGVQTACSTSLVAVHLACQGLISGECDMALAGGVAVSVPERRGYLYQERSITSPDGCCRTFDARAAGTIRGNGAGIVVLRRLGDALESGDRVLAVIRGSALNNDGSSKVGYTAPSVSGQAEVIAAAQAVAGVAPETIGYVEAHGTATALGDPIEVAALTQAFGRAAGRRDTCALGSIKSNLGHLDAAAGVAGLIKTVLSLWHGELPASLHYETPNPGIDFAAGPFFVNTRLRPWPPGAAPRRAGVSAFGIGGTNAHVVLEEAPRPAAPPPPASAGPSEIAPAPPAAPGEDPSATGRPWQLLVLSARSEAALRESAGRLAEHLGAGMPPERSPESAAQDGRVTAPEPRTEPGPDGSPSLADAAYTLQVGRRPLEWRWAAPARGHDEACARLVELAAGVTAATPVLPHRPAVAFVFPGQGAQYAGMGADLYREEPVFRAAVEECCALLGPALGGVVRHWISAPDPAAAAATAASPGPVVAAPAATAAAPGPGDAPAAAAAPGPGNSPAATVVASPGSAAASAAIVSAAPDLAAASAAATAAGPPADTADLHRTWLTQPALFVCELALARLWMSWGVVPAAVAGNSVGELVAACLAGVLPLAEALRLVALRGRLMQSLPPGAMVAVALGEADLLPRLGGAGPAAGGEPGPGGGTGARGAQGSSDASISSATRDSPGGAGTPGTPGTPGAPGAPAGRAGSGPPSPELALAAVNGPRQCVVSGPEAAVAALVAEMHARGVAVKRLRTSHAFHSPMMEPILEELRQAVAAVPLEEPRLALISSLTGRWAERGELTSAAHWSRQARQTVRFGDALTSLLENPGRILLEVGPGQGLRQLVRDLAEGRTAPPVVSGLRAPIAGHPGPDGQEQVLRGLAQLWQHGVAIDWPAFHGSARRRRVALPTYPFERQRFYLTGAGEQDDQGDDVAPVLDASRRPLREWFYLASWERSLPPQEKPASVLGESATSAGILAETASPAGARDRSAALAGTRAGNAAPVGTRAESATAGGMRVESAAPAGELPESASPAGVPAKGAASATAAEGNPPRVCLILADEGGLGEALAGPLRDGGWHVILASAGSTWQEIAPGHVRMCPGAVADHLRLWDHLASGPGLPQRILHLWNVGAGDGLTDADAAHHGASAGGHGTGATLDAALDRSFYSLFHLAQNLGRHASALTAGADVLVFTARLHAVESGDRPDPVRAALAGPCRVMMQELAGVRCRIVDLDPTAVVGAAPWLIRRCLAEIEAPDGEPEVAWRGPHRWLPAWKPAPLAAAPAGAGLRPRGVYLVTGGLGGLGLEVARQLAESVRARLVLVGRTPFLARPLWDAWLAEHAADEPAARVVRRLRALEALGAELLLVAGDVTDAARMAEVRRETLERFGALHGVFHAAGIAGGGLLAARTTGQAAAVLAPKVLGTLALAESFAGPTHGLDLLVLFSSLAALTGGIGQADYSAANAFQDSFAAASLAALATVGTGGTRVISVNWDAWQEVGMAAAADIPRELRAWHGQQLATAIHPDEGREALARILAASPPRVAVSTVALAHRLRAAARWRLAAALEQGAPPAARARHPRPAAAGAYAAPATPLESRLAALWQELLGIEPIGRDDDFFALGGHSLLAIQLAAAIRVRLAREVPLQSILAHPTPALLAAVIATLGTESGLAVPAAAPAGDTASAADGAASFRTVGGAAPGTASGQADGAVRPASGAVRRVVALQPGGPRQPFFCVHPAGGNTFVYKELAEHLGTEQPFHAIQSDGLDDELLEDLTIAGMAASYVAAIRAVRPHGPVHLGGWSMGGLVAFEMAQQLRAAGGEVGLLVLFDTRAFTRPDDVDELPEDDVDILHALLGADLSLSLAQLQALPAHRVLSHVVEEGRRRGQLAADFGIEQAQRLLTVYKRNRRLMWDYLPRPYPGAMTLIQARERRPGENPPLGLGWDPLIAGGLSTHLVPGNHNNLMIPPHVGAVAELLRTLLAATE